MSNHRTRFSQVVVANLERPEIHEAADFCIITKRVINKGSLAYLERPTFGSTGPIELRLRSMAGFWQCIDKEAIQSSFIDVFDGRLSHDSCPGE